MKITLTQDDGSTVEFVQVVPEAAPEEVQEAVPASTDEQVAS